MNIAKFIISEFFFLESNGKELSSTEIQSFDYSILFKIPKDFEKV